MMQHGNQMMPGNQMRPPHQMQPQHQVQPIVCPTQYRCRDQFIPREVPVIHPIVNVNRQHVVEIPRHFYTETTQNVMGQTLPARPGFGPMGQGPMGQVSPAQSGFGPQQMGGWGQQCGGRGRRSW